MGNQFSRAHRVSTSVPTPPGDEQAYIDLITAANPLVTHNVSFTLEAVTTQDLGDVSVVSAIAASVRFTYECVVRVDDLNADVNFIYLFDGSSNEQGFLVYDSGVQKFKTRFVNGTGANKGQITSTITPVVGQEYHLIYTHVSNNTSNGTKLYINGVLDAEANGATAVRATSVEPYSMQGNLRGVAIYDRLFAVTEVVSHYNAAF